MMTCPLCETCIKTAGQLVAHLANSHPGITAQDLEWTA